MILQNVSWDSGLATTGESIMKLDARIAGVGMTRFSKFLDRGLKSIGAEAVEAALKDAGIDKSDLQAAWVGNAAAGLVTGRSAFAGRWCCEAWG
jgi:acetyl-CoA acetyltransferase